MKSTLRAFLFLLTLTLFDFLLRKGMLGMFIPFQLPQQLTVFVLFSLFAIASLVTTKWFCKKDSIRFSNLGISYNSGNRREFFYGVIIGIVIWGIVSLVQSVSAGFSWEFRPEISWFNILYGFLFIFIADLGTELYTRGYPLVKLKEGVGEHWAIWIMTFFVGLKSFDFNLEGELLFYTIIIPALHTIFFSIIYFKTKRLGAALGIHTGANFVTISIFDLRVAQPNQAIPSGIFQSDTALEELSLTALQWPWVAVAIIFSIVVYFWKGKLLKS